MQTASQTTLQEYQAILPDGSTTWHDGSGQIGFSFLDTMPGHYASADGYVVAGTGFAPDIVPAPTAAQETAAIQALSRLDEVARLGLQEVQPPTPPAAPPGTMATGLGGPGGFGETVLPRSDDGYFVVDLTEVFPTGIDVYGTVHDEMFVNTNGSVSFGNGVLAYTPRAIEAGFTPMFAPFWGDVDTRAGALAGAESGEIHVDIDTVDKVVTVTWDHVNFYDRNGTMQNSFQIQLAWKGQQNYNLFFRYGEIDWVSGDASGGTGGLGGAVATAGVTAGDGARHIALPASGQQGKMRQLDSDAGNTFQPGIWQFKGRDGDLQMLPGLAGAAPAPEVAVPTGGGLHGDIAIGALDFGAGRGDVLAAGPGLAEAAGDVWLNLSGADATGGSGQAALLAGLGEALGLSPSHRTGTLAPALDTRLYTMMSANPVPGQEGVDPASIAHPATPMLLDIQALQAAYGANMATRAGDDVYFAPGGTTPFTIGDGETLVATIWDAGGTDTFSAENQSGAVEIDLRPGRFSTIGGDMPSIGIAKGIAGTGALSARIENATGGAGDDVLIGNSDANTLVGGGGDDRLFGTAGADRILGGAGSDRLVGGSDDDELRGGGGRDRLEGGDGDDRLLGGGAIDFLFGGAGADVFVFAPGTDNDRIYDFEDGLDVIDLSGFATTWEAVTLVEAGPGRVKLFIGAEEFQIMDAGGTLRATDLSIADFFGLT